MKHVVIKYPNSDKIMMEGYVDSNGNKYGLWLFYNNEGHILYRINYDDENKLDGPQYCGPADVYNEYNYDKNEMTENVGHMHNRRHFEFDVISTQAKKEKIHKELPAIGEYYIMALENNLSGSTSGTGIVNLYMPIIIKRITKPEEQRHIFIPDSPPDYFMKGIICVDVLMEDVEKVWVDCTNSAEFDKKFLKFLSIKTRLNNNRLVFDNYSDNIKDLIIDKLEGPRKQYLNLEFTGEVKLQDGASFGWESGKPKTINNPTIIVESCHIEDTMFDGEIQKLWNVPTNISAQFVPVGLRSSAVIDTYGYDPSINLDQKKYGAQYRDPSHPEAVKTVHVFNINSEFGKGGENFSEKYIEYYYSEWYFVEYDQSGNLVKEYRDRTNIGNVRPAWYGYVNNINGQDERRLVGFAMGGWSYNSLKWFLPTLIDKTHQYKLRVRWCSELWKSDWFETRPWDFTRFYNLPEDRYRYFLDWRKYSTIDVTFTRVSNQADSDRLAEFDPTLVYKNRHPGNYWWDFNYRDQWTYKSRTKTNYPYIHVEGKHDSAKYINFKSKKQESIEFPKPSYSKPHPAELFPDTSWELITTDMYIEHISAKDYNKTNRDNNDKLKPATNLEFNLNINPISCTISGRSFSKKVIVWITDNLGVYYPKYVTTVKPDGRWEIVDAICMLPYNVRTIKQFTLHCIPIYKEGFGLEATKDITIPEGFRRSTEIKVLDKFKLSSHNINVVSEDDTPVYIWRRTGDHEQYHPYTYDGIFKEYCIDVPEDISLFREGRYKTDILYNNILTSRLDGEDKMYIRGNLIVERNWNFGTINPTIKLFKKDGASLATVDIKNNHVYNGKINVTVNDTWTTSVNFINPLENTDYKSTIPVVGNHYKGIKIATEIENKKA